MINYDVGTNETYRFSTVKGNNNFGKKLINLCKITGLRIVNWRKGLHIDILKSILKAVFLLKVL